MKKRYELLDTLRGLVLISMILYHATWDLVYMFGKKWSWYHGTGAYLWQQSICWTFILLSGFCWSMGRKPLKRGCMVFGGGMIITFVTLLLMPENRVVFGVLTLIGSCMLLMVFMDKVFRELSPVGGILGSVALFILTRNVNDGYLGFEGLNIIKLPEELYRGLGMTFLGFPHRGFYSTDYFSLIPWLFLFGAGYFLYHLLQKEKCDFLWEKVFTRGWKPLSFLGKHSLIIYLLHQPLIYGILMGLAMIGIL